MFIKLEDDVFEDINSIKDVYDVKIIAMDSLFDAMIKGKHIVYSKACNLSRLTECELLSPRTVSYVKWVLRNYAQIYSCKSAVARYISVSSKYEKVSKNNDCYMLPISLATDINETKLMTEQETDAKLYLQIANYVYKDDRLQKLYSIRFENDALHGANGGKKIEQISEMKRQALCIVDTDQDYPGGKKGSTYVGINDAIRNATRDEKNTSVLELIELPVREKENMIPISIYKEFTDTDLIRVIAEFFPDDKIIANYFDIKDGIKYKKIKGSDERWIA